MGRKVKCRITGEFIEQDIAYKASDGKYYKSQELYEEMQNNNLLRNSIVESIAYELLGYEAGQPFPTAIFRKLKEIEFYSMNEIFESLMNCKNSLIYQMEHKSFNTDYNRICYIFGAIKNEAAKIHNKNKNDNKEYQRMKNNMPVDSMAENLNISVIHTTKPSQPKRDISRFLDD